MSDDIKSGDDLSTIVIKLQNRISELEANTIISNELQIKINDKLQDYIKINTSNIQNNFKGFKDFKFLQESQMKRCDHLQEQIAELGKRIGNAWESISELEASSASHTEKEDGLRRHLRTAEKEIAELKNSYVEIEAYSDANKIHINELKEDCKDYRIETRRIEQIYKKNYNEMKEDSGDDKKYIDPVKQTWYNTKTHIVVKREDLQTLYNGIDMSEIKRIKEEYNL